MELVFCTNNKHKLDEVRRILPTSIQFKTLKEIDYLQDIPEPFHSLEENSLTKAKTVADAKGMNCFSEDTGLFIEALNGEPGVFSARYAGEHASSSDNIKKILDKLGVEANRHAFFKTVITLIVDKHIHQFSGECHGTISTQVSGQTGFGYDPIFIPDGYTHTFADMIPELKNEISHRKKAFDQLANFLRNIN